MFNSFEIKPINANYHKAWNRLYKLDRQYSELLDTHQRILDDKCHVNEDFEYSPKGERLVERHEMKEEALLERAVDIADEMPKRELVAFEREYIRVHGYESYAIAL